MGKDVGAIGVESDVFVVGVMAGPCVGGCFCSEVGDDGTGEVDGLMLVVEYDFGGIRVLQVFPFGGWGEGGDECGYLRVVILEALSDVLYLSWMDEGLVTLYVDDDGVSWVALELGGELGVGFLAAVGSAAVVWTGEDDVASELLYGLLDAYVVCGYDQVVDLSFCLAIYVLDEGFACEQG